MPAHTAVTPAPGQLCACVHTFVEHDEKGCMTCRTIRRDGTRWHIATREPCHGFHAASPRPAFRWVLQATP
jgi:hypothetical protein